MIFGTQGDNQPFVSLSKEVAARGVTVELWAFGEKSVSWMRSLGINALLIDGSIEMETLFSDPVAEQALATGDIGTMVKVLSTHTEPRQPKIWDSLMYHCKRFQPTLLVYTNALQATARSLHDIFGFTVAFAQLYPRSPTVHEPPVHMAYYGISLPCGANKLMHRLMLSKIHGPALASGSELQKRRRDAGLPPLTLDSVYELFEKQPVLCGWSPAVFDGYEDMAGDIFGYWMMSDKSQLNAFQPSDQLRAFLVAGPPPAYIGWGSMLAKSGDHLTSASFMSTLAVETAMLADVRVIILGGWAQLSLEHIPVGRNDLRAFCAQPHQVFFASEKVPHSWLLPYCTCAVIHGGAGTTGAVLHAGIPCVITPVLLGDQPWWAKRVAQLGVGVGVNKMLRETTSWEIAEAIGRIDDKMRAAATKLAARLNRENGAANAGRVIAELAQGGRPMYSSHTD